MLVFSEKSCIFAPRKGRENVVMKYLFPHFCHTRTFLCIKTAW